MSSPPTEAPGATRLSPLAISGTQSRLRGPSPIRERLDQFRERVGNRLRSHSSASTNSNNTDFTLSNAIINVGTTSAAVGAGEGFKTTYENDEKLENEHASPLTANEHNHVQLPIEYSPRDPVRSRVISTDGVAVGRRDSVRNSVATVVSLDSFHTARSFGPEDESPISRSGSSGPVRYPGAHMFMRQFSAYLARENSDANELYICERTQSVDCEAQSQDSEGTLTDSTLSSPDTHHPRHSLDEDEPPLQNVLNIEAYHNDPKIAVVQMRALLDTGNMGHNIMSKRVAELTGKPIETAPEGYATAPLGVNSQPLNLLGVIRVRWYFSDAVVPSTRSYDVVFQVVEDPVPFDVALSFQFLQDERVFRMSSHFAMTITPGTTLFSGASSQSARHAQAEEDRRRREAEKERRRAEQARKRAEQKAKK